MYILFLFIYCSNDTINFCTNPKKIPVMDLMITSFNTYFEREKPIDKDIQMIYSFIKHLPPLTVFICIYVYFFS